MEKEITISSAQSISTEALYTLYQQASWSTTRTLDDIKVMLDNTSLWLEAWRGERLIGFVRVLSDDRYRAFIEDVIIAEEERGQGVGHQLMAHLMQRLSHVELVTLVCEEHLVPFYERHGFVISTYPTEMKRERPIGD